MFTLPAVLVVIVIEHEPDVVVQVLTPFLKTAPAVFVAAGSENVTVVPSGTPAVPNPLTVSPPAALAASPSS
jgi:gamma-glutamyl phosphate reductase